MDREDTGNRREKRESNIRDERIGQEERLEEIGEEGLKGIRTIEKEVENTFEYFLSIIRITLPDLFRMYFE